VAFNTAVFISILSVCHEKFQPLALELTLRAAIKDKVTDG
jgi:hypothetical protein